MVASRCADVVARTVFVHNPTYRATWRSASSPKYWNGSVRRCAMLSSQAGLLSLDARIGVAVLGFLFQTLGLPNAATAETAEESAALR